MSIETAFIAVRARDIAAAEAIVYRFPSQSGDRLDVVILGKKSSGDVRFHVEPSLSAGRRRWSAAAGLAVALFPSVAADRPTAHARDRAMLAAVSGRVATALGRSSLKRLGEFLDAAPAAVVVAVDARHGTSLAESLGDEPVVVVVAVLDPEAIDAAIALASHGSPEGEVSR